MESYNMGEKFIDEKLDNTIIKRNEIAPSDEIINKNKNNSNKKELSDKKNKNTFLLNYFDPLSGKFEHMIVEKHK